MPSFEDNISALLAQRHQIETALSNVIDFEEALANITAKPVDSRNLVPYKISQLSAEFPFLDWDVFFKSAFTKFQLESPQDDTEVLIQARAHY